ncbi:unnamed protein product [Soboliphyme baturini]|uniref:Nucleos_tra2_C domain-containing protein n=1 Tax=Soboliphyme baturini TaxID=241478 RepID=A0A183IIM4_9BILA|nr:unnamed protein product [Soboliphyme baturini]
MQWQPGVDAFGWISKQMITFLDYTVYGTQFVYGFLAVPPAICGMNPVLLFSVLQAILYFGSCVAVLYHFGIMQFVLMRFAWITQKTMTTTAAESLNAVASIILGMTEAPILIRPYLAKLTKSEVVAVLCGGFSTIAGSLFAAYVSLGVRAYYLFACPSYILSASIMSAPAALSSSKLFYPETEESKTKRIEDLKLPKGLYKNVLEAISVGATSVITIIFQIGSNLIVFTALLAFINAVFAWLGSMVGVENFSFERLLSYIFFPIAFIMGVSLEADMQKRIDETMIVAELMGTKIALNEFIAYQRMSVYLLEKKLTARAQMMASFALCSFGNVGSIGIQLGGIGGMCPEQKPVLAEVAVRALIASICANFMTTCWAGK